MTDLDPQSPEFQAREIRAFAKLIGIAAALLAALPAIIGWLATPAGRQYLPFHMSLDDHMVYAAWMRQAMDGHVLFDNRFTTTAQPGLTFHAFFLLLGWFAKAMGIPLTLALARIGLSFLAVRQIGEFLIKLGLKSFAGKYALVISCFGGGVSYLYWQTYGDAFHPPGNWFTTLMMGRQPIDNWQPEAFMFPSMLTNALFLASACLILCTLNSVLDSRVSWKPVLPGAIAFGVLMNIHSYDVLLVALVLVAFAATLLASKSLSAKWALRVVVIGLGAIPAALWFLYVLRHDPVFQSRAATPTYTGNFRQIVVGIIPLIVLAGLAALRSSIEPRRKALGLAGLFVFFVSLFIIAAHHTEQYFFSPAGWVAATVFAIAIACAFATKETGWNLLWAWAMISVTAPYFPALFQRKLSMMLAVPWAIIGAIGLARELEHRDRQPRNLVAALTLAVVCLGSVFWLKRDVMLVRAGVSRTLTHNLVLTHDETRIVAYLDKNAEGAGVLAMPGVPSNVQGEPAYLNDLSPVLSGLAGVHTYAGHWSETPEYDKRRTDATAFYIYQIPAESRIEMLKSWKISYVVIPKKQTYSALPLVDISGIGKTVYDGIQLSLVKVGTD